MSTEAPGRTSSLLETVVGWTIGRPRVVLLLALLAVALSAWRVTRLQLRTELVELLPQNSPSVRVLRDLEARFPSTANVILVVQGPDDASNRRLVDDIVPSLRALADPEITDVEWGVQAAHEFYRKNAFLYASLARLQEAQDDLQREILRRKNPAFIDFSDGSDGEAGSDDEAGLPDDLIAGATSPLARFPHDHFATPDGKVYAVIVHLRGGIFGRTQGERTVAAIDRVVRGTDMSRYHAGTRVGLTGNLMSGLAERRALESDLKLATTACAVLVGLAMFVYFRSLGLMASVVLPAVCGVLIALAFAQLAFGYLNAATAFMASIILGNGINYAIVQAARYQEERRAGRSAAQAAVVSVVRTGRATGIAAFGAALAYGALVATRFRGFSQFGYIGAVGMVVSWLLTLTVLPALWTAFDRRREVRRAGDRRPLARAASALVDRVLRRPRTTLAVEVALTVAALAALPHYLRDPFEYDFRKLGNQSRERHSIEAISREADRIFGRSLSPGVVLVDRPSDAALVKQAIEARDPAHAIVARTTIVEDLLPGDPATQEAKLRVLTRIRHLVDQNLGLLSDAQRARLVDLRPPDDLRVLTPSDLPFELRRYFTERDGTIGRIVLYYPPGNVSVWDGRYLLALANLVETIRLGPGHLVRSSGVGVVFADMVRAIAHDGPEVTAVALAAVLGLLVAIAGWRRDTLWVLLTLVAGVVWMAGIVAAVDVRINFLNFIALPITFGIGVDYGINLIERYRQEAGAEQGDEGGIRRGFVATGGAVTLCSLTTIIGYAALLLADNQALRSFGAIAILGELACLNAALWSLPGLLSLRRRGRGP